MSQPYREPSSMEEGEDEIVTAATYSTAVEADMARELLKENGIPAFSHEAASFNPLINVAAGGARVLVRASDEARARSLLARVARTATDDEDDTTEDEVRCPRCELTYCFHESALGSPSLQTAAAGPLVALLLAPLGLTRKRWRCHKCLYVWDDRDAGPRRKTLLHPEDPKPVFRLRRHRAGTGLLAGIVALALGMPLLTALKAPPGAGVILLALPILGYFLGRRAIHDACSEPACRAPLGPDAVECRACRGTVAGVIRGAHEHYSEAAAVRRELAAERRQAEEKAAAKVKRAKVKKKRALPADAAPSGE
jgi:Putative prokaryotic signal transducing protein